jgi:cellulose synthase/poly-beta-1,6-N-acetylglucosamine synthase-like glycosyltransferase
LKLVFWLSLSGILYTYLGYPVWIWTLSRLRPNNWKSAHLTPSVSIVLAVHNGAGVLADKIKHLLSLDYPNIQEIVVVSDGSTDGTAELLAAVRHPRVRVWILREHEGKAAAINAGVAQASGDVILFVDVRKQIAPGSIQRLVRSFADPQVGCVNGEVVLRSDGRRGATAAIGSLYWRYEKWLRACEARFDSLIGVDGGFYAIRRELFMPLPAGIILDDMFQPLSIIRQGYRVIVEREARVFDTWPAGARDEFQRKVRTLAGNFQLAQLAPWTLTPQNRAFLQLISHKYMRLSVPYLLVLLQASSLALFRDSQIYATFAVLQLFCLAISVAALRYRIPMIDRAASAGSAILMLNSAAVAGLYRFLFTSGPLWKIWHANLAATRPPASQAKLLTTRKPART